MRYILICETPFPSTMAPGASLHVKAVSRDEYVQLIGARWTDKQRTLAILEAASDEAKGQHFGIPVTGPMGRYMVKIEGEMDRETNRYKLPCPNCQAQGKPCLHRLPFEWVDSDHICSPRCLAAPYRRISQTVFQQRS